MPQENPLTDPITAAVALGMPIPAPAGTHTYLIFKPFNPTQTPLDLNPNLQFLSTHTSVETALKAYTEEIRRIWKFDNNHYERRNAPWATKKLYKNATKWRTLKWANKKHTEEETAQELQKATQALHTLRTLETKYFQTHTDIQIIWQYLNLGDYIPTLPEIIKDPYLLHPYLQEITIQP